MKKIILLLTLIIICTVTVFAEPITIRDCETWYIYENNGALIIIYKPEIQINRIPDMVIPARNIGMREAATNNVLLGIVTYSIIFHNVQGMSDPRSWNPPEKIEGFTQTFFPWNQIAYSFDRFNNLIQSRVIYNNMIFGERWEPGRID